MLDVGFILIQRELIAEAILGNRWTEINLFFLLSLTALPILVNSFRRSSEEISMFGSSPRSESSSCSSSYSNMEIRVLRFSLSFLFGIKFFLSTWYFWKNFLTFSRLLLRWLRSFMRPNLILRDFLYPSEMRPYSSIIRVMSPQGRQIASVWTCSIMSSSGGHSTISSSWSPKWGWWDYY